MIIKSGYSFFYFILGRFPDTEKLFEGQPRQIDDWMANDISLEKWF